MKHQKLLITLAFAVALGAEARAATRTARRMPGTIGSGPGRRQSSGGLPIFPALTGIAVPGPGLHSGTMP